MTSSIKTNASGSSPHQDAEADETIQKMSRKVSFSNILEVHETEAILSKARSLIVTNNKDEEKKQMAEEQVVCDEEEKKLVKNEEERKDGVLFLQENDDEEKPYTTQDDVNSPEPEDCKDGTYALKQETDKQIVRNEVKKKEPKTITNKFESACEEPVAKQAIRQQEATKGNGSDETGCFETYKNEAALENKTTHQKERTNDIEIETLNISNLLQKQTGTKTETDEKQKEVSPASISSLETKTPTTNPVVTNKTLNKFYTSSLAIRRSSVDDVKPRIQNGGTTTTNKNTDKLTVNSERVNFSAIITKTKRKKATHNNKIQKRLDQIKAINEKNLATTLNRQKSNNTNSNIDNIKRTFEPMKNDADADSVKSSHTSFKCKKPTVCTYKSLDSRVIGDSKIPIKSTSKNNNKSDKPMMTVTITDTLVCNLRVDQTDILSSTKDETAYAKKSESDSKTLEQSSKGLLVNNDSDDKTEGHEKQETRESIAKVPSEVRVSACDNNYRNEGKKMKRIPPSIAKKPIRPRTRLVKSPSEQTSGKNNEQKTSKNSDELNRTIERGKPIRSSVKPIGSSLITSGISLRTIGSKQQDKKETTARTTTKQQQNIRNTSPRNSDRLPGYRARVGGKGSGIAQKTESLMRAAKGEKPKDDDS